MDPNLNALWCRCLAEELARCGLAGAALCPGSRNSPLLFALAAALGEGRCRSLADERAAAFWALGLARASGAPAAVCVTSGSALANCLPALCEARACRLPLVVIAADRPWELHGNGAPQSMPQAGTLPAHLAAELALGEPTADDRALRALRARTCRLLHAGGPVLINVPLRDPLPPLPDPGFAPPAGLSAAALHGRGDGRPYTRVAATAADAAPDLAGLGLRPGLRGVIAAGAVDAPRPHPAALALAAATGFPLLADAVSGLRGHPGAIAAAGALAAGRFAGEPPELVVQLGQAPLTRAAWEWLDRCRGPWIAIDHGEDQDCLARADLCLDACGPGALAALGAALGPGDPAWLARWRAADAEAGARLAAALAEDSWSEPLAAHLALTHPGFTFAAAANSMAVRHAELLWRPPAPRPLLAARGVSGIDGTLAHFAGAGARLGRGLLLCGDLAALHDLPGLLACAGGAGGAVVVLDNGGGGIFDALPVAQVAGYERWVRAAHAHDLAPAAAIAGLALHRCRDRAGLMAALDAAAAGGWHLVLCDLRGAGSLAQHRRLLALAGA